MSNTDELLRLFGRPARVVYEGSSLSCNGLFIHKTGVDIMPVVRLPINPIVKNGAQVDMDSVSYLVRKSRPTSESLICELIPLNGTLILSDISPGDYNGFGYETLEGNAISVPCSISSSTSEGSGDPGYYKLSKAKVYISGDPINGDLEKVLVNNQPFLVVDIYYDSQTNLTELTLKYDIGGE